MLVIRLQRTGKKHQASFRIVLQDRRWRPGGKVLELFGFYNPRTKEKQIQAERVKFWISRGAQPSATLHNLFVDEKIIEGPKMKAWQPKKKKAADSEKKTPAPEAVKETPTVTTEPAESEETPKEEAPALPQPASLGGPAAA